MFIFTLISIMLILCGFVMWCMWDMPVEYSPSLMGSNPEATMVMVLAASA